MYYYGVKLQIQTNKNIYLNFYNMFLFYFFIFICLDSIMFVIHLDFNHLFWLMYNDSIKSNLILHINFLRAQSLRNNERHTCDLMIDELGKMQNIVRIIKRLTDFLISCWLQP